MSQVTGLRDSTSSTRAVAARVDPQPRLFTAWEFHRLADLGMFDGQKAELIEGQVMVQSPQKPPHYYTVDRAGDRLEAAFGKGFVVRKQGPLELGVHSEPEPDIAVVRGSKSRFKKRHPRSAVLVVEVSDTTLANDRERKASLYARAEVADYWIINLIHEQVEVLRDPIPDAEAIYGFSYRRRTVFRKGETVQPLEPKVSPIAVDDLLP